MRIARRDGSGRRPALLYKTLALILAGACAGYLLMMQPSSPAPEHDGSNEDGAGGERIAAASSDNALAPRAASDRALIARPAHGQSLQDPNLSIDLADYLAPGSPVPTGAEVIERLNAAGIHSGIGAFQPHGTSPPLIGLAVPDDFELPEGYVRHFQATDDGQRIEPILMFSPDYQFFDASGRPINIPENRVVPPELAPPGLTIRPIKLPPPLTPGRP
ncbi:MAG: hypothetical protein E6Q88_13595 [Lysobacteraceae bacterium]|nr:MAG: hypothetical protein E6Q88_13595 [Xanthomonadaceae bacterium]